MSATSPPKGIGQILVPVDDGSAALELLESRGAPVRERPEIVFGDATYDLWLAFVTDPVVIRTKQNWENA